MSKRFTDTDKWDDDWFIGLPPRYKCVWEHLRDTCDGAGFKKISFAKLTFLVGEPITREEFDRHFEERLHWVNHEVVWIHGFIGYQYKQLSPGNRAHLNIAKMALRTLGDQPLSSKAQAVADRLAVLVHSQPDPDPTLSPPSSDPRNEGRAGDIGNRKQETGNRKGIEEGGVGETGNAPPPQQPPVQPITAGGVDRCKETWKETLRHFDGGRSLLPSEELTIARAIQLWGAKAVELALMGARNEPRGKEFEPSKNVSLERVLPVNVPLAEGRERKFQRFLHLGTQQAHKAAEAAEAS